MSLPLNEMALRMASAALTLREPVWLLGVYHRIGCRPTGESNCPCGYVAWFSSEHRLGAVDQSLNCEVIWAH